MPKISNNKPKNIYDGVSNEINKLNGTASSRMNKKDWRYLAIIFAVLAFFTFINFGTTNFPETSWESQEAEDFIIFEVPDGTVIGDMWINYGIAEKDKSIIKLYTSDEITSSRSKWTVKKSHVVDWSEMYRYLNVASFDGNTSPYIVVAATDVGTVINEIVVIDDRTNEPVQLKVVMESTVNAEYSSANLVDEKDTFTGKTTNKTGMYFDEVYHARSAFEMLNGMQIYENTHPPLGKIIIAVGISIFGMNPFGWRIMGALFSLATVVLAYFFGKRVFKKSLFAVLFAGIFACDGLRYTLGRIATIDSFAGFFIMLSFYFMYKFYEDGVDFENILKSLIPFALAGIAFGFSVAVKWTGFYAGLALLIMFIIVGMRTLNEYLHANDAIKDGDYTKLDKIKVARFGSAVALAIFTGLVFYILVPLAINVASFAIFLPAAPEHYSLFEIFQYHQGYMWNYHTNLADSHNSGSPWWSWILNGKGVYMMLADDFYNQGMYARIQCMGTTAICVFGIWSLISFGKTIVVYLINKKNRKLTRDEIAFMNHIKKPLSFILIAFFGTWLPWAFIGRVAYIYHFYASMMFLIMLIVLYLYSKTIIERDIFYSGEMALLNGRQATVSRGQFKIQLVSGIVLLNFLLFLPVFAGLPVSNIAAMLMFGWANGWWGYGLAPNIG